MKRLAVVSFLTLAACLLTGSEAAAQGFGFKGGRLWSEFRGSVQSGGVDYARRGSWSVGIFLNADLKGVRVRPELLFSQRGADVKGDGTTTATSTFELDYVELPVLIVLGGSPSVFFGPYGAVRTSAQLVTQGQDASASLDVSDTVESVDYGLVFGLGTSLGALGIEARYALGLKRIFKPVGADVQGPDIKHQAFGLFLGISF